jgi:3-oxoacyl-[acyl-carrier protein] reductase
VHAIAADLSRTDGIVRVVSSTLERFGRIDVLVTNAGGPPVGPFEAHDWPTWQRAVELTLRSAVELTRAVLPGMRERRWGRVLHVTSLAVKQPIDGLMLSTSIRSAVTGFSRTLANEVAAEGVTVNTILPGFMNTERVVELNRLTAAREKIAVEEVERRVIQQIPTRRIGEPRELAALAVFLASERASYITGQSIAVDGGWIRALL